MKRFTILAALIALVGCSQYSEELDKIAAPIQKQTEFHASMPECDTRTYVEDNKYLRWNAGDEITVFNGNSYNSHWQFAGEDGANSGKFNEVEEGGFVTGTPLNLTANYAIYPYDENITITESGVVSLTLPAVQEYNHTYANSFGAGANTMMAVTKNTSDNFLAFKNLCGYLKLKFYGDDVTVKNITVKGNSGEKIAGGATVTMVYGGEPTITMGNDATDTITIDCGEGVTLSNDSTNPTIFWVVIPETTFEGGITIEVADINNQTFEKKTTNAVPIENNLIQPMAALEVSIETNDFIGTPKNNEIWYINGSKDTPTKPFNEGAFNTTILSNSYDAQKKCWVIVFDKTLATIGYEAFRYHWKYPTILNIKLPESVTSIGERAFIHTGLQSILIPNSVKEIGPYALSHCTNMEMIIIGSGVTSIGDFAFSGTTGKIILNCNIPSPLHDQGQYATAFSSSAFSEIIIGDDVTSIGEYAFDLYSYGNNNLNSITIGKNVSEIGYMAFRYCEGRLIIKNNLPDHPTHSPLFGGIRFTEIIVETEVSTIGTAAFMNCYTIKSLYLEKDIKDIDDYAFYGCTGLSNIYCKALTPPNLGNATFGNISSDYIIYVPSESVEIYKSAWSSYASHIEEYDFAE